MRLKPTKNKSKPKTKCVWDAQKQKNVASSKRKFFHNQYHSSLSNLILGKKLYTRVTGCCNNSTGWNFKNS